VLGVIGFLAVGISLGLLGGGGSILAVPVLVYLMGYPASVAVPLSLPVVGLTAAIGAAMRWRRGQLQVRTALLFGSVAMVVAYLSARFGTGIPDRIRLILFAVVMPAMWLRANRSGKASQSAKPQPTSRSWLIVAAAVVGMLTGVVGVGGGFMIVPALVGVLGLPMATATATSLAVIAMNSVAATAGWAGVMSIDVATIATISAAALVGMVTGTALAPKFQQNTLVRGFAILLVTVAVVMLWRG
jgi:uncharacterized membrane protein YfcA